MKKVLFALCTLLMSAFGFAQRSVDFRIQCNGTMLTTDGKEYAVIDCDGKTQQELFKEIESAVGRVFVKPSEVVSKVEGEQITITGLSSETVGFTLYLAKPHYTIVFRFKDGKIRVDAPTINYFEATNVLNQRPEVLRLDDNWLIRQKVFDKKTHEPRKQKIIDQINGSMNGVVNAILNSSVESQDW